jgi:leucyl-tRNA synthetase
MGPMDGYPDFRDTGIEGMRRFVEKVWQLFQITNSKLQITNEKDVKEILVKMHQTIKKVTEDIEKFHFNTAISAIMEYVNLLREKVVDSEQWIVNSGNSSNKSKHRTPNTVHKTQSNRFAEWDEALEVLLKLLAPFAPFITEEIWDRIKNYDLRLKNNKNIPKSSFVNPKSFDSINLQPWPKYNPEFVREEEVTIAVQVNGKLRAKLTLKAKSSRLKAEVIEAAKSDSKIQKWLEGKKIKNTIFIPGKLINFVTT